MSPHIIGREKVGIENRFGLGGVNRQSKIPTPIQYNRERQIKLVRQRLRINSRLGNDNVVSVSYGVITRVFQPPQERVDRKVIKKWGKNSALRCASADHSLTICDPRCGGYYPRLKEKLDESDQILYQVKRVRVV